MKKRKNRRTNWKKLFEASTSNNGRLRQLLRLASHLLVYHGSMNRHEYDRQKQYFLDCISREVGVPEHDEGIIS